MYKAYKYRIRPSKEQQERLAQFFGCTRFVFNACLETRREIYEATGKTISQFDLCKQVKDLKNTEGFEWLKEVPAQSLQVAVLNACTAYKNFFNGSGFPKFKGKKANQSISFPQSTKVDFEKGKVSVPKLKCIKCYFDRTFTGKIKTSTITKTKTGKYYISILVDNGETLPQKAPIHEQTAVGLDMGIKHFCITSDGEYFENQRILIKNLNRLRREQRSFARKQKGSNRRNKQRIRIAKLHERISNLRKDFLHKLSTYLVRTYDTICVETLNVKGMLKNRKLSKHIADQSWSMFLEMIKYKCDWYGKNFVKNDRWFASSKTCNVCNHKNEKMTLSTRLWTCDKCGTTHDRDENAAINNKKEGLRLALHSLT